MTRVEVFAIELPAWALAVMAVLILAALVLVFWSGRVSGPDSED